MVSKEAPAASEGIAAVPEARLCAVRALHKHAAREFDQARLHFHVVNRRGKVRTARASGVHQRARELPRNDPVLGLCQVQLPREKPQLNPALYVLCKGFYGARWLRRASYSRRTSYRQKGPDAVCDDKDTPAEGRVLAC